MNELMFQAGVKGMSERSELIPCIIYGSTTTNFSSSRKQAICVPKSAPPTEGSDKPGPFPTNSKPTNPSKQLKLNSPHPNQESQPPGAPKSAPPTDGSHNPDLATKLDNCEPTQASQPILPKKVRDRSW